MYSTSMFPSPPGEQFFFCDDHTSQISQAYVRTNEATTALTLSCSGALNAEVWACLVRQELPLFHKSPHTISIMAAIERIDTIATVLDTLKNRRFISAEFAENIIEHYPNPSGGVMQWPSPISFVPTQSLEAIEFDMDMDTSDVNDEEETLQHDSKRCRFNG